MHIFQIAIEYPRQIINARAGVKAGQIEDDLLNPKVDREIDLLSYNGFRSFSDMLKWRIAINKMR